MNVTTDRCARSRDIDSTPITDDDPDARQDPHVDRRYEAHVYSRDVVVDAFLEGRF